MGGLRVLKRLALVPVMGLCLVVGCSAGHLRVENDPRPLEPKVAVQRAVDPVESAVASAPKTVPDESEDGLRADVEHYLRGLGALDPGPRVALLAFADDEKSAPASDDDLTKQTQNPISDLISVPLQSNFNFNVGPGNDTQYVLNIQPVIPVSINEKWNMITRTILPVIDQPGAAPGLSSDFGLGDTLFTAFFSPKESGGLTWGVGPAILIPTSTSRTLGAGEWGAGLSAVGIVMDGPWVVGGVVSNVWSFDGTVNSFTLQPIINYNLEAGWYLVSAPLITANWEAASGQRWTVPVGIGAGKVVRFGKRPVNISLHAYYNVEHANFGPEWTIRFQIQFLFPK